MRSAHSHRRRTGTGSAAIRATPVPPSESLRSRPALPAAPPQPRPTRFGLPSCRSSPLVLTHPRPHPSLNLRLCLHRIGGVRICPGRGHDRCQRRNCMALRTLKGSCAALVSLPMRSAKRTPVRILTGCPIPRVRPLWGKTCTPVRVPDPSAPAFGCANRLSVRFADVDPDPIAGRDSGQPKVGPPDGGQDARSNVTCVVPFRYRVFSWYRTLPFGGRMRSITFTSSHRRACGGRSC